MTNDPSGGGNTAFGRPGIPPTWSTSSKDGVGTAYATSSRVWFSLARGILTEAYYPTIDHPQIRDAQFLITDGATFFHEEKRDLATEVARLEAETLGYRCTSKDPKGRYQLIKEVISDPHQSCVLVNTRFVVSEAWRGKLQIYFLLAPHLEVGGWGNSARRIDVAGRQVLLAWKSNTYLALGSSHGFHRSSCGFVGFSDGWQDLNDNFKMDWEFDRAEDGNIAVMGEIDLSRTEEFTVGIAFGDGWHAATSILTQSLAVPFAQHRARFIDQWKRICETLEPLDKASFDGGHLYRTSRNLLLSHEDKTFAGAFIASASIPWGDAMGDEDLGGYHLVWTRDMVNSALALLACGDKVTPLRALIYLACSQQLDGGFPQNFWVDGTPYWKGVQLDEVAFPIILAWRLWQADAVQDFDPYSLVKPAVRYLIEHGPITQQERWEECSGFSPSTLAATIAALICAAHFARSRGDEPLAKFVEEHADFVESHIESWTVTTQGSLVPEIQRHYIRILPVTLGETSPIEDPNLGTITIANTPPGAQWQFPAKEIVDAGFLELVRYGIRKPGDPLIEDSLRVIDAVLKVTTPGGPCWRRYNHDGYGPHTDGKPYTGWGEGRAWPLLAGERAHYELAAGRDVRPLIAALENFSTSSGMLPEQIWDRPDIPDAFMYLGKPCGAAMPLMWAHAEYIKLLRSVRDQRVFDRIAPVADRYLEHKGRKDLEVWKSTRRVREIAAGKVLRILLAGEFGLRWSLDEGRTGQESVSTATGLGLGFVDIPTQKHQGGRVQFSFTKASATDLEQQVFEVKIGRETATGK
ncbi:MAG TPA: glycoside hydrolase family 15 protein [Candidatus Angelobacter sp.]|nr:glycoside hydrolase family 15 protein [Candidatus Angelobacter sp.]